MNLKLLTVLFLIGLIDAARILGVFHFPPGSHYTLESKLIYELAARGHEVTFVTPVEQTKSVKNIKHIKLDIDLSLMTKFNFLEEKSAMKGFFMLDLFGLQYTERVLKSTTIRNLLQSGEHFDAVIIEQFVNEALKGLCFHFKAPCIVLSSVGSSLWTNLQVGNPAPPSYVSETGFALPSNMNFWERTLNSLVHTIGILFFYFNTLPKHNAILQKYFPSAPHLQDLYHNTSLILLNSHISTVPAVPRVPNMVEIGGYHIDPPKKLPKDLQDYLDDAIEGAVYFSLGSNIKSKDIPLDKQKAIINVFSRLKQKVLWKWENETLPEQPPNVKISKWLPQQDILAHPNIKLFITHGGLLSTIETIYHGVPIVGIPVYGDQASNVVNAELSGYAVGVPFFELTEKLFGEAVHEVLSNPKYAKNVKLLSKIMHDQHTKPMDRAMFWVEYVIRHRGAPHLRSEATNLYWYQYLLLDVVAFLAFVVLIFFYVVYKFLKLCYNKLRPKKVKKSKKKN